ncbi:MAG TPA: alginate lyase family protein [Bacteroidia bacterium]|nr:alginate lyase family protein [Bacteroidia bacterium]
MFFLLIKPLRKRWAAFQAAKKNLVVPERGEGLVLQPFFNSPQSLNASEFTFLNLKSKFDDGNVDWNFSGYALLWNYHLNYFDFLHQENLNVEAGLKLIHHFIDTTKICSHSFDPYPVSLRGVNWIKFLIKNNIDDSKIDESLYRQYIKLSHEVEYHIGANHLLENGFSLLFGAFYFHSEKLFQQAENILLKELKEQILTDGAHVELSTMYHRIILHRVLDCVNLMKNKRTENNTLEELLKEKASAMLSWLDNMTFRSGEMPDFNDSAKDGVPSPAELNAYAKQLGVYADNIALNESGYRKLSFPKYEMIVDACNIMPSYNPGHTHSDMLSFCLNINDKQVIVDCGISTYENNSRRKFERSTSAHNTVSIEGLEQSDMWASFRVGKRARILERVAEENSFASTMIGFTSTGIAHKRLWTFLADRIAITDYILENHQHSSKAYLHFHPDARIEWNAGKISSDNFVIEFKNHNHLVLEDYDFAEGFNLLRKAKVAVISFSNLLDTEITL